MPFGGGVGWEGWQGDWVTSVAKNQVVALNLRSSLNRLLTATETVHHHPKRILLKCCRNIIIILL